MGYGFLLVALAMAASASAQPLLLRVGSRPGDGFGRAIALAPPYLAISAPGEDEGGADTGAVYVFRETASGWVLDARLKPDGLMPGSRLGEYLALNGTRLAVSAHLHDQPMPQAGAVFVYERTASGHWRQTQQLAPPLETPHQAWFGSGIALEDTTLFIRGVRGEPIRQGILFVYTRSATTWTLRQHLLPTGTGGFGQSFLLQKGTLLVSEGTQARRFTPASSGPWTLRETLRGDGTTPLDVLAVQGRHILAGQRTGRPGTAEFVLRLDSVPPPPLSSPVPAASDGFGWSLAASDTLVAVGAPRHLGGDGSGVVYLYETRTAPWSLTARLSQLSGTGNDRFGEALALHGSLLLVGAPGASFGAGAVYLYDLARAPGRRPGSAPLRWLHPP